MSADLLREAASLMRERAEAATPGPWRFGDNQLIAGVTGRNGEAQCSYCSVSDPAWSGWRDINGAVMEAHVHLNDDLWRHGIYAERSDGHVNVVNDTDEYGYMRDHDAVHIASWHPAVGLAVADWLHGVALFVEAKDDEEYFDLDGDPIAPEDTHAIGSALTVARAYLGRSA